MSFSCQNHAFMSTTTRLLIIGYCRQNSLKYFPFDIIKLCNYYCYIGEEFDKQKKTKHLMILGSNNNTCKCNKIDTASSVLGTNLITSKSNIVYYHWKFKVIPPKVDDIKSDDFIFKSNQLAIGLVEDSICDDVLSLNKSFVECKQGVVGAFLVDNIDGKYCYTGQELTVPAHHFKFWSNASSFILDMYLDMDESQLLFETDPQSSSNVNCRTIDSSINYRVAVSLSSVDCSVEILSFNCSAKYDNLNDLKYEQYINSALSIACKKTQYHVYYKRARQLKNINDIQDYISCCIGIKKYSEARELTLQYQHQAGIRNIGLLAIYYYDVDSRYIEAKQMFELINDDDLFKLDLAFNKARVYKHLNEFENAEKCYKLVMANAVKLNDNDLVAVCWNNIALLWDDAIKIDPGNPWANLLYANLLYAMNRIDESIPYFIRALANTKDLEHLDIGPLSLQNYGNVLFFKQKFNQSLSICNRLIKRKDFKQNLNKDQIYMLISRNYDKLYNINKALEYAKKAQKINANNTAYSDWIQKLKFKLPGNNKKVKKRKKKNKNLRTQQKYK